MSGTSPADKKKLLNRKVAAINKRFQKVVINTADQVQNPYFVRRPTGIMELDIDLAGGFPPGVSYISGPEGAGKSHLLYRTMAMHQRLYGENSAIALAAVEAPMDHFFMRKLGLVIAVPDQAIEQRNQWRKDRGLPPFSKAEIKELKRQVGTFFDITGATMEETLGAVIELLADKDIRQAGNQMGIIGIDSVNALMPQVWLEKDLDEEPKRAAHSSCMTRFFGQYYPLSGAMGGDPQYTTVLFTQQVRSNPAKAAAQPHIAKWLPDYAPAPGSYAAKHGKLIDLMIWPGQKVKDKKRSAEDGGGKAEILQKIMGWELLKGKAGTHEGRTGEVLFDFERSDFIDLQRTVLTAGIRRGIFKETGGLITYFHPFTGEEDSAIKDMAVDLLLDRMREDPAFESQLRLAILASAGIKCGYYP